MINNTNDIFNSEFSRNYDAYNGRLGEIGDNLHLLISLLLNDLPQQANILCVGVGTGTEILRLALRHPEWRFTGVDPSPDMLAVCAEKLEKAGISSRCQLVEGRLDRLPVSGDFDAALCLLVAHFILDAERYGLYDQMASQLRTGGRLVVAEIAGEIDSPAFDEHMAIWARMHEVAGQGARDPAEMKAQLAERLLLLAPEHTEALIARSGFTPPLRFFQSLLIHGWSARKIAPAAGV